MITLSTPVFYRHKFVGVLGLDMAIKELTNAVKNRFDITAWSHRLCGSRSKFILPQFLILIYVYSQQPIPGLTQEWFRELSFFRNRLECGVHDKLHISSANWWDLLVQYIWDFWSEKNRREMKLWGYIPEYPLINTLKVPEHPM